MYIYACLIILLSATYCRGVQNIDTENKKVPNAICFKDTRDQTMELNFYVLFNGNQVDRVMALSDDTFVRNSDGTTNEVACTKSDITQGNVQIRSKVSLSGNNDVNRCGARRVANTNNFRWVIEVRALYSERTYVDIDRRYFITCVYDDATSNFAVAQVAVFGSDDTGLAEKLNPINTMAVLTQQTTGGPFTATDTVNLDQSVKLQVGSLVTSLESVLEPYGVYPFTCDFGPFLKSQRTIFILINGCPAAGNSFGLAQGFQFARFASSTVANKRVFQTETPAFVLATAYPPNNYYYLSCYVGYCYGTSGSDTRCTNYCASSSGRKRRQAELSELDSITIAIRVTKNTVEATTTTTQSNTEASSADKSSQLAIIIGTSVASLVFLVILLMVVIMLCCRPGCCCSDKDRLWEESTTGSTVTSRKELRPVVIDPANFVSPKA